MPINFFVVSVLVNVVLGALLVKAWHTVDRYEIRIACMAERIQVLVWDRNEWRALLNSNEQVLEELQDDYAVLEKKYARAELINRIRLLDIQTLKGAGTMN